MNIRFVGTVSFICVCVASSQWSDHTDLSHVILCTNQNLLESDSGDGWWRLLLLMLPRRHRCQIKSDQITPTHF